MFRSGLFGLVLAGTVTLGSLPSSSQGDEKKPVSKKADATTPIPRMDKWWKDRHKKFLAQTREGKIEVVFLGDSITHGWESQAKVWNTEFGEFKPGNYGIGGDQTGHVIWRVTEGKELEGISPKVATIMIGTNNMGSHGAEEIAAGVKTLVEELRRMKPKMKILVLGIFPRSAKANDPVRSKIKKTNAIIAKLADDKMIFYKDIGEKFLEKDGTLSKEIMPDYLHLSARGYQIWADAIKADLAKLVKE